MDDKKGLKRLIRFYNLLDDLYSGNVESVKNSIQDGEINERTIRRANI